MMRVVWIGCMILGFLGVAQGWLVNNCIDSVQCNASENYFPISSPVYLELASWTSKGTWLNLTVMNGSMPVSFTLVRCGCPLPLEVDASKENVLFVPTDGIFVGNSVILSFLEHLGALEQIVAIQGVEYMYSPGIHERVEFGVVENVLFEEKPQSNISLALWDDYSPSSQPHVLPIYEYREASPLARAEWIKVLALVVSYSFEANAIFVDIENSYKYAMKVASESPRIPSVIANAPYNNTWYGVYGYTEAFLNDSQAVTPSKGISFDNFDSASASFASAEVWINTLFVPSTTMGIYEYLKSSELGKISNWQGIQTFQSVRCGQVWSYGKRQRYTGQPYYPALDYFESGVVRPDLILLDLVQIFYPDSNISRDLYYYSRVDQDDASLTCDVPRTHFLGDSSLRLASNASLGFALDRFQVENRLNDTILPVIYRALSVSVRNMEAYFLLPSPSDEVNTVWRFLVYTPADDTEAAFRLRDAISTVANSVSQALLQQNQNLSQEQALVRLLDATFAIPASDSNAVTASGIVGIVLGSIAGLVLVALLSGTFGFRLGRSRAYESMNKDVGEDEVIRVEEAVSADEPDP